MKLHQSQEPHLFPRRKCEMSVCKPYFFLKSHGPEVFCCYCSDNAAHTLMFRNKGDLMVLAVNLSVLREVSDR